MRHREKIEYMNEWKKLPDHFHYTKFFDPYLKKEYEMIRTASVNNSQYSRDFRSAFLPMRNAVGTGISLGNSS